MVDFEFYNPVKIVFGDGASARIGELTQGFGRRALIVSYAQHAYMDDLLQRVEQALEGQGIAVTTHYVVTANPLLSHVRAGVALCRERDIAFVVGVGGGSVMDSAKAIAAGATYEGDVWGMFMSRHDQSVAVVPPTDSLPTVMIPTLPATSSEMNCIAVITNDETTEKSYVSHPLLYPKLSIMDPRITCSLPPYQTGCGCVDAISHILEAYFNCVPDTPLQDRLQEGAVVTLMELGRRVLRDPADVALRANIQWASSLAWNGWLQAGIDPGSPMHQIGHVLSARYGVTHGATLGIVMPAFFRYVAPQRADRFVQFGERMLGLDLAGMAPLDGAYRAIDAFERFIEEMGVQTRLTQVNVPEADFAAIADDVVRVSCNAAGYLPSDPPVGRDGILEVLRLAK